MSRWWAVVLLALSVGFNAGLGVALLQQRSRAPEAAPAHTAVGADRDANPAAAEPGTATGSSPAAAAEPMVAAAAPREPVVAEQSPVVEASAPPPAPSLPAAAAAAPSADAPDEVAWLAPGPDPGRRPFGDPRARGGGGPGGPRRLPPASPPQERLEEMAARLGVPEADRPELIALQRRFLGATRDGRIELEGVRRQLKSELVSPQPDRATVDELLARSAALQADLERALVEHVLEARELLDGEAEMRYLHFLSRLNAGGGPGPGASRPGGPPARHPGLAPPGERPRRGWPPPRRRFEGPREPAPSPPPGA